MSPHTWGVFERKISGWGRHGPMFRVTLCSRHKSEIAARQRCRPGQFVRRLRPEERR